MRGGVAASTGLGVLADDDMPEGLLHQATVALLESDHAPGELCFVGWHAASLANEAPDLGLHCNVAFWLRAAARNAGDSSMANFDVL
jgi:hypothetical protein